MSAAGRLRAELRRRGREAFLGRLRGEFAAVGLAHAAGVFVLPSNDRTVLRKLYLGGDRSEFVVLARAVATLERLGQRPAGTLVDVGANLGTTTLAALRLHGFDRAVACEPDPVNARFLRATVVLNGVDDRVAVLEVALADRVGEASFKGRDAGADGRNSGAGGLRDTGSLLVSVTTLDALAADGVLRPDEVGLLWMDAQGAEGIALAHAECLLDAGVPVVTAVRAKRLAKLGGLDAFIDVARSRFSSLVDLRHPTLKEPWEPVVRPVAEIDELLALPYSTDALLLP